MLDSNDRSDVNGSIDALERTYAEAVCVGGLLSARRAHEERLHSAIELLAHITTHTPHLTLLVFELADSRGAATACLTRDARRHAALVIRLAHRALDLHSRDLGYQPDAWRERAVLEADAALTAVLVEDRDPELGLATAAVIDATIALAAAIAAVFTTAWRSPTTWPPP
jgi:hypothetical protein